MNTALSANSPADHTTDRTVVLWLIILTEIMLLCIPGKFWWEVGLSVVALAILFGVLFEVLRGRGDFVIMGWVLIFPLGYYFFSFPREHPIITLDRVFLGILLVASCFADYRDLTGTPRPLLRSALYWAFFLLLAAVGESR